MQCDELWCDAIEGFCCDAAERAAPDTGEWWIGDANNFHPHAPLACRKQRRYPSMAERLLANSIEAPMGEGATINSWRCRWWLGGYTPDGYGKISMRVDGRVKSLRVHRVSYQVFVGPIDEDMTIEHLCQVSFCIEPAHLTQMTLKENCAKSKGRFVKGGRRAGQA